MSDHSFKKVLTRMDVLFLAFGAMIGWGWVVLSGNWVSSAGMGGAMTAFIIGGIMVTFVGLTYAELASAMPSSSGGLSYILRGIGPKTAFIGSWSLALGYISVVAFEAVALPTVVEYIFPNYKVGFMYTITDYDVYASWVMVGVVGSIFVTAINYLGMKLASIVQMILTIMIAVIGLALIFGSGVSGDFSNADPLFTGGMAGLMGVMVMTPFMFVGFDVIPQTTKEMNVSPKSIGKILIVSVIFAVVFYLGVIFSVGMTLDEGVLNSSILPAADAMAAAFNSQVFATVLIVGGIAGILTSWNAFIIGGSRDLYAMAERKMIPAWFGKLHPKTNSPTNAILFIGGLSTLAPLLGRPMLVWLVDAGGLAIVIMYLLVAIAFVQLRKNEPQLKRPFRAGSSSVVGWIAVLLSVGFVILYMPGMPAALIWPYEWAIFAGWWVIGGYLMFKMHRHYAVSTIKDFNEEERKEG